MLTPEQMKTVETISNKLASKYTFGIYDEDDIRQEIFIIAVKAMEKYDPEKASLENFLFVHVSNRLKTLRRDNYYTAGKNWIEDRKRNIQNTVCIDNVDENNEQAFHLTGDPADDLNRKYIFQLIDKRLPPHLRLDYLRMIDGNSIPTSRRDKVVEAISSILKDNGYAQEDW